MTSKNVDDKTGRQDSGPTVTINEAITDTPWGAVDVQTDHATGIAFVSTASHGGFVLSDERAEWLQRHMPGLDPFSGDYHYWEEDSDVHVVIAAFPEHFTQNQAALAVNALRVYDRAEHTGRLPIIQKGLHRWATEAPEGEPGSIFAIIADGLDASTDGRGWGAEHEAARLLADAAPKLEALAQKIAAQDHMTGLGPQLEALINGWIDDARAAVLPTAKGTGT